MASPAKKSSARIPAQPEATKAPAAAAPAAAPIAPAAAAPAAKAAPAAAPAAKAAPAAPAKAIDARERYQMVAREAYFLAEKRGFAAGRELEDWIVAEKTVAARLAGR